MVFEFGRKEKYPTHYGDQHTAAHTDVVVAGILTAFFILGLSLFAVLPAFAKRRRIFLLLQIICSLSIGGIILIGNYGHSWEVGKLGISSPYKPGSGQEIKGEIGIQISLRGINITLTGEPIKHNTTDAYDEYDLKYEIIDYNEHFSWEWAQGRFGFGYYAGQISKDFRAAVNRGTPIPILQLAEYFTFDGEGIRFGRYYRTAGWYCHGLLWCAFTTWIIANILFTTIIRTASLFLLLTGLLQMSAICIWTLLRNPIEIHVPFQSPDTKTDYIFSTHFGLDYYAVAVNGVFCMLFGALIFIVNAFAADEMCDFFGIDPLTTYDEHIMTSKEIEDDQNNAHNEFESDNEIEMGVVRRHRKDPEPSTSQGYLQPPPLLNDPTEINEPELKTISVYKRHSNVAGFTRKMTYKLRRQDNISNLIKERAMALQQPLLSKNSEDSNTWPSSSKNRIYDSFDYSKLPAPPESFYR